MTKPFPYTSLACRLDRHDACESLPHADWCGLYCVLHCACYHHKKRKPKEPSETTD